MKGVGLFEEETLEFSKTKKSAGLQSKVQDSF